MEKAEKDIRKFDERPVPRKGNRQIHFGCLESYAARSASACLVLAEKSSRLLTPRDSFPFAPNHHRTIAEHSQ
jgi:hypothetical protein